MDVSISSDNAAPSSPPTAIFSDELQHTSSPPSSPPGFPWEQIKTLSTLQKKLQDQPKTAFSVLGKRKVLEPVGDNVRPKKKPAQPAKPTGTALTQMQISLGQEVHKKCKTCGVEYIHSSAEDRSLHNKYHKRNTEGYDVGKDFVLNTRPSAIFKGVHGSDIICKLTCFDKLVRKRRGHEALEIVQRELGAVDIPYNTIWGKEAGILPTAPDYAAHLYMRGTKCIGLVLVQKIKEAYEVVESNNEIETQEATELPTSSNARDALKARQQTEASKLQKLATKPIVISKNSSPAALGISRIWTSAAYRGQNIATTLLDTAFADHNSCAKATSALIAATKAHPNMQAGDQSLAQTFDAVIQPFKPLESKDDVAFSQPTEAGARLARRWFGKTFGWKVYVD